MIAGSQPASSRLIEPFQHGDAFGRIVEAIEQGELLAAGAARKVLRPRIPSSSSVSMQSAEKPGAAMATRLTPCLGISRQRRIGRGLEPLRAAEPRLEGDIDVAAERFGQQPRGLPAMAMIGIAELQRPLRHSVEAQQQPLGLEVERRRAGASMLRRSASM